MRKILLSLFVLFVGVIGFSFGEDVYGLIQPIEIPETSVNNSSWTTVVSFPQNGQKIFCVSLELSNYYFVQVGFTEGNEDISEPYLIWKDWNGKYSCLVKGSNLNYFKVKSNSSSNTVHGTYFYLDELLGTEIPVLTSLECQERYSLIPIENIDSNYCEINGLCPVCPDGTGFSNFYVRHGESTWFQLTGMENYYVYLPDYLNYNYDYSYGTDLNFTVGVSYDTGYIDNVNAIQNSKPSQEDLNKLISEVIPLFVPGLAVILLLYFIFRFIKKVF